MSRQEAFRSVTSRAEKEWRKRYPRMSRKLLRKLTRASVRDVLKQKQGIIVVEAKPANWFERVKEFLRIGSVRYAE